MDRLGRDALDVQATVRALVERDIIVEVLGLGVIARGVGALIVAVLAQIADMERQRIKERCESGRIAARAALTATGRTHRGKVSMGRPTAADADAIRAWRSENSASITKTATQFGVSAATVKRTVPPPLNRGCDGKRSWRRTLPPRRERTLTRR